MTFKNTFFTLSFLFVGILSAYIVRDGDTLWDLSEEFLGDPFRWPGVWEINQHIEDPHWIYPGDEVKFPGEQGAAPTDFSGFGEPTAKKESEIEEKYSTLSTGNKKSFKDRLGNLSNPYDPNKFKNISQSKYLTEKDTFMTLNTDFIIEAPRLVPPATKHRIFPEEYLLALKTTGIERTVLLQESQTQILKAGKKHGLKKGDILEIYPKKGEEIATSLNREENFMVEHTTAGLAEIIEITDEEARVKITKLFSKVTPEESRFRTIEKRPMVRVFQWKKIDESAYNNMARVVHRFNKRLKSGTYEYVAINQGLKQGIALGDIVAFWQGGLKPGKDLPPHFLGSGIVVNATGDFSTILIRHQQKPTKRIAIDDLVGLTHRVIE